ncbi:hypothetical protein TEA_012970 [Camellia sinensis var. sinensis]|uniref:Thioredoxin domain-containing protein n=1 Tax=Camellia sinensis var. sinensis TaxID=542762 RepID=A0A4S4F3B7_CAMSN|nr:hypothetical protein TEA_012970 [Camellia sinensis var. sinensis]
MQAVCSILSTRAPPQSPLCLSHFPLKIHQNHLVFPSSFTTAMPSLLSGPASPPQPRKFLCQPPSANYVRQDYLVKKLSSKEVQELVKGERNVPLIIDFYATWCGPCILMAQELEMMSKLSSTSLENWLCIEEGEGLSRLPSATTWFSLNC